MEKLFLIGGTDSIGVPYTKDNKKNIGFYELISQYLSTKFSIIEFNFFHMSTYNTNAFIKECIENNYSLKSIKEKQNEMLKKCKYSGIYPFLELPKRFLNFYKIKKTDNSIKIKEELIKNKSIFLYSAGTNDFLKHNKSSLFKMFFPNNIKNNLKDMDSFLDRCIEDIQRNITYISSLNNNCEIYLIGLFYPTNLSYIRKKLTPPINAFNQKLKEICNCLPNLYFVDNSNLSKGDFNNIDFHPNRLGHQKIYENFIKIYQKQVK